MGNEFATKLNGNRAGCFQGSWKK